MKIAEKHSHLNGLEFLLTHKPDLWKEIQEVIIQADGQACDTKICKDETRKRDLSKDMRNSLKKSFEHKNWMESRAIEIGKSLCDVIRHGRECLPFLWLLSALNHKASKGSS